MAERDEIACRRGDKIHAHPPLAKLRRAIGQEFFDDIRKDEVGRLILDKSQTRKLVRDMEINAERPPQPFDARLLERLQELFAELRI